MFEIGSAIVMAIVEGVASALTSHVLKPKAESREPMDIRLAVNDVAREMRAKDRSLEISVAEMGQALKSVRAMVERVPEFEVKQDDKVTFTPRKDSDVGDVLYRLDEEIAALRKSVKSAHSVPPILEGLDEEIATLRTRSTVSEEDDLR